MELICISVFSITRAGTTTVYPKYTDHVIALRQDNRLLSPNLFSIHCDGSHVMELSQYDAIGTVLMPISDARQYKKVLEKLYMRVLVHGAEFDHQPKFNKTYDTTLILKTRAPLSVIMEAVAYIADTGVEVGSLASSPSPQNIGLVDGTDSLDGSVSTAGDMVAYNLDRMREHMDNMMRDMKSRQTSVDSTLVALKDAVVGLSRSVDSLQANIHGLEDRCDIIDGHIAGMEEYSKPIRPIEFGSQSDTGSSVCGIPVWWRTRRRRSISIPGIICNSVSA